MTEFIFNSEVISLLKTICIYCLNGSSDLKSIYIIDESNINLVEFTKVFVGIDFTSIGYCTPLICSTCMSKLLASHEFQQQCLESMEQLQNIKIETDKEFLFDTNNVDNSEYLLEIKIEEVNNFVETKEIKDIRNEDLEKLSILQDNIENDELEEPNLLNDTFENDELEELLKDSCDSHELQETDDQKDETIMLHVEPQLIGMTKPVKFRNRYGNCPICGCVKSDVKRHLKSHLNADKKGVERKEKPCRRKRNCPICCEPQVSFGTHLRSHKLEKHRLLYKIRNKVRKRAVLPVSAICQLCGKDSDNILVHFQTFHMETDDKDDGEKDPYEICYICGSNVIHLEKHLQYHMVNEVFTCDICNKTLTKKAGLIEHMKIHLNKREYKCRICPAAFNVSASLRVHMNIHIGYRKHKCKLCDQKFLESCQLTRHIRVAHIKLYNLQCRFCDKLFCAKEHRYKHERRVHKIGNLQ